MFSKLAACSYKKLTSIQNGGAKILNLAQSFVVENGILVQ